MKKLFLALCFFAISAAADDRTELLRKMDAQADHFGKLSRQIWEYAEVGYKEVRSSALLKSELRSAGFRIEENIGGMPTAFTATWGQGKPVVAILGEFDALPDCRRRTCRRGSRACPARPVTAAGTTCSAWPRPLRPSQ